MEEFFEYFKGCKQAYAVKLCDVVFLGEDTDVIIPMIGDLEAYIEGGLPLSDFGLKRAP